MLLQIVPYNDKFFDIILKNQMAKGANLSSAMGARIHVGIRLSYRPASLCSLAAQFQTRFLAP